MSHRPIPPEDIPTKTTPYFLTGAWIDASAANGNPHAEMGFFNQTTPAPRFLPTVNPQGITVIQTQPEQSSKTYSAKVIDGWNVSGEYVRTV